MSRDDREQLFSEWVASRDVAVRNRIVESYAPLAEFFANRYKNRAAEQDDLRQVAHMALVGAVERFDPECGVKFSTFAGRTIDGELKRYFRDKTWAVRVPRSLKELSLEVRGAAERLERDLERSPSVAELAAETGLELDVVIEALNVQATGYRADSLSRPAGNEDGALSLGDTLPSSGRGIEVSEIKMAVRSMVAELPDRERRIIVLRFFEERSQQEMGISQMHVSRILRRTFEQLRAQLV